MIIKPKVRGFICITAHPVGCERNVLDQIAITQAAGHDKSKGPKRVLVIGASTGYGLASRITAAFGYGAATLGVFFEKPSSHEKTGTAGWYNSAAFDKAAKAAGLYSKSINGDAFANETRAQAIEIIKNEMGGPIDLVVYSLASPVRKLPDTGEVVRSALKTIGAAVPQHLGRHQQGHRDRGHRRAGHRAGNQGHRHRDGRRGLGAVDRRAERRRRAGRTRQDRRLQLHRHRDHLADVLARHPGPGQAAPGQHRQATAQPPPRPRRLRRRDEVRRHPGQRRHPGDPAVRRPSPSRS